MNKKLFSLLFIVLPLLCYSQISGEDEVYLKGDYIEAKFNGGGLDKFYEYVNTNVDKNKITKAGKLVFTFDITITGEVKNIKIIEFPDIVMATEIIRVIKKAPNWEPAKRGGKAININIKFPIQYNFKVN
jgi:hypothetical protein